MRLIRSILLDSLALLGIVGVPPSGATPQRTLVCDMTAFTPEQRHRHEALTRRLLEHSRREDLADGYRFTVDREHLSVSELAGWVADESRCCPGVDFHVDLPAFGPLTLRIDGGADVKEFLSAELRL